MLCHALDIVLLCSLSWKKLFLSVSSCLFSILKVEFGVLIVTLYLGAVHSTVVPALSR